MDVKLGLGPDSYLTINGLQKTIREWSEHSYFSSDELLDFVNGGGDIKETIEENVLDELMVTEKSSIDFPGPEDSEDDEIEVVEVDPLFTTWSLEDGGKSRKKEKEENPLAKKARTRDSWSTRAKIYRGHGREGRLSWWANQPECKVSASVLRNHLKGRPGYPSVSEAEFEKILAGKHSRGGSEDKKAVRGRKARIFKAHGKEGPLSWWAKQPECKISLPVLKNHLKGRPGYPSVSEAEFEKILAGKHEKIALPEKVEEARGRSTHETNKPDISQSASKYTFFVAFGEELVSFIINQLDKKRMMPYPGNLGGEIECIKFESEAELKAYKKGIEQASDHGAAVRIISEEMNDFLHMSKTAFCIRGLEIAVDNMKGGCSSVKKEIEIVLSVLRTME